MLRYSPTPWARVYELRTAEQKNEKGRYFVEKVVRAPVGVVVPGDVAEYARGIHAAMRGVTVKIADDEAAAASDGDHADDPFA